MTIEEKLVTINQNMSSVYDAGKKSVGVRATASGNPCVLDYVHPTEHELGVRIQSKNQAANIVVVQNAYYADRNNGYVTNSGYFRLEPIPCKPKTTYTMTSNAFFYSIKYRNSNQENVDSKYLGHKQPKAYTFTTPADCEYIGVSFYAVLDGVPTPALEWFQLEEGTTATEYTPYVSDLTQRMVFVPDPGLGYNADENGVVRGIKSVDTEMNLVASSDVTITAEYYLDAKRKINDIEQAIVTIGGDF